MAETGLNADELRGALDRFEFDAPEPTSQLITDYFRFYGLAFTDLPGVKHQFGYFDASGYRIALHYFSLQDSRGTLFVQHGYYDHAGLYTHPIRHFLKIGYNVVIYDQPGHGLSTGDQASIADFEDYQLILTACMGICHGHCPVPWHILGQSMGGAITMTHLLKNPNSPFSKAILLAPLIHPAGWGFARWLHALGKFFMRAQKRVFALNSHDAQFLKFLSEDDFLQAKSLPMQWVTALKKWISEFPRLGISDVECLVLQGTNDQTVAWRYNMKVVLSRFSNSRIHYLPGAGHQLVNESLSYRTEMFNVIDHFLGID